MEMARRKAANAWIGATIISGSPLITISTAEHGHISLRNLAVLMPKLFDVKQGLHLLSLTWNLERPQFIEKLTVSLREAQAQLPGHLFVVLANSETEVLHCSQAGIACIPANGSIFVSETEWRPCQPQPGLAGQDAIYIARLSPMKRHKLAAAIDRLILVYGPPVDIDAETALANAKAILPNAHYANHAYGEYAYLDAGTIGRLVCSANVGLCLSADEGYMRASIQYLLCGRPLVSTRSLGGRDRYYSLPFCMVVDDDADAVARGVHELASRKLDPQRIRTHTAELIAFERHNFLAALRRMASGYFGQQVDISSFDVFRGAIAEIRPVSEVARSSSLETDR